MNVNFYTIEQFAQEYQAARRQEAGNHRLWTQALKGLASLKKQSTDPNKPSGLVPTAAPSS